MKHKRLFALLFALLMLWGTALSAAAAGIDGSVELAEGKHAKWIDRLDLSHVDAAPLLDFYEALEEAVDNDGVNDFLIDDHAGEYLHRITTVTGSFTANNTDEAQTKLQEAGDEILARYKPFVMAVFDAFDRDHPEVFWLSGERSVGYEIPPAQRSGTTYSFELHLNLVVQKDSFDMRSAVYPTAAGIKAAIAQRDNRCSRSWTVSARRAPTAFCGISTKP